MNRSIPACTGEPRSGSAGSGPVEVYPRVYGGTPHARSVLTRLQGLSPRVRGNPYQFRIGMEQSGSIPACTGEPIPRLRRRGRTRVYPRVYGGTIFDVPGRSHIMGLSPRVRGNRFSATFFGPLQRSIPACTGEPVRRTSSISLARVYPRVYGGTPSWSTVTGPVPGLSPRVRGNPQGGNPHVSRIRSIPACTGEPRSSGSGTLSRRVYPRVYGGTGSGSDRFGVCLGLSPRVRGNRGRPHKWAIVLRSIPACTGEPLGTRLFLRLCRVYPRVYGGTLIRLLKHLICQGLSPRVRGNR